MKNFEEMFEIEAKRQADGYKTGFFTGWRDEKRAQLAIDHKCDCLGAGVVKINWYTTRNSKREPVIRVEWFFPTYASRKVFLDGGRYYTYRKTWECTDKQQLFPFTSKGLESAIEFAKQL